MKQKFRRQTLTTIYHVHDGYGVDVYMGKNLGRNEPTFTGKKVVKF
jgi:hypothetical protein